MSRDLTAATKTAIAQPEVYPFFAVQLSFSGGIIRMWTGQGTLTLDDGTTWIGLGQLLSIPANLIALALTEPYQGREAKIYFGINGEDVFNELFSGYMDQMNIEEGVETATIELAVENRLIDLERARVARFTSGYQKSVYPNDDGLNFLEDLQDKKIPWGRVAE